MNWPARSRSQGRLPVSGFAADRASSLRTLDAVVSLAFSATRPSLLDMGPPVSANIEFFGEKGFKIFVEDFLRDYLDAGCSFSSWSTWLRYPPSTFGGVLCWNLLDYVKAGDAGLLVQRLFLILKPGGLLLALFGGREDSETGNVLRHKILTPERVVHEPVPKTRIRSIHYPNREIMRLFGSFEIVRSFHHKSGFREYLFRKGEGPSLKQGPDDDSIRGNGS